MAHVVHSACSDFLFYLVTKESGTVPLAYKYLSSFFHFTSLFLPSSNSNLQLELLLSSFVFSIIAAMTSCPLCITLKGADLNRHRNVAHSTPPIFHAHGTDYQAQRLPDTRIRCPFPNCQRILKNTTTYTRHFRRHSSSNTTTTIPEDGNLQTDEPEGDDEEGNAPPPPPAVSQASAAISSSMVTVRIPKVTDGSRGLDSVIIPVRGKRPRADTNALSKPFDCIYNIWDIFNRIVQIMVRPSAKGWFLLVRALP